MLPINRCAPALPALCVPAWGRAAGCPAPCHLLDVQSLPFHPPDPRGLGTHSSPRVGAVPQEPRARLLSAPGGTRPAFRVLCAPAGITAESVVIPVVWRVSQPSHVHMSGQFGDSRLTWRGAHAAERALCQHTGRGVSPLCEASGKEKEVSQPFQPLLCLSQFFCGHLDLQIHCSYLAFVGDSMEFVSAKVLLQALNVLVYSSSVILAFS